MLLLKVAKHVGVLIQNTCNNIELLPFYIGTMVDTGRPKKILPFSQYIFKTA